jgi:hypothetical protein
MKRPAAGTVFLILCVGLAAAALAARAVTALGTSAVLDWDETYYASTTSTAAHGLGLYPYVLGYPQIHNMGGLGYVVYLYVAAYNVLGPHLAALRLVSLLASLLAIAGAGILTRQLYGSAAGLAAVALTPSLLIVQLSNTIRMDVFAIAYVAWALVLYVHAARRDTIGLHALVGTTLALGLEVHLHTAAAAFAIGCAYVAYAFRAVRRDGLSGARWVRSLPAFVGGYVVGAALFLALNVLPDSHAYFRTAALARLSAVDSGKALNLTAPMDAGRLAQTFLSPRLILRKEIERYGTMVGDMRWWEALLWAAALPTYLLIRRGDPRYPGRLLLPAAAVGGGIVFNSSSPLYVSAILPFFVPALATFVTHGFSTRATFARVDVSFTSVILMTALAVPIVPPALSRLSDGITRLRSDAAHAPPAVVTLVTDMASSDCILAGPADLYAPYFMQYPRFVGTREVEILIGSTYYDLQHDLVAYWHEKRPDVIFGPTGGGLGAYLAEARYVPVAERVWKKPDALSPECKIAK